jgi:hypothetical protein
MGGLVARYFIECLGGWKDTAMLITFGTPYHGSVKALQFLIGGYQVKVLGRKVFDFSAAVRSFPSTYQLLPMYPCLDLGDGRGLVSLRNVNRNLPNMDSNLLADAIAFYREMAEAVTKNKKQTGYSYEIHPIVGTEQNTELRAALSGGTLSTYSDYPPKTWQGDTTVPWISAHPLDNGTPEPTSTYYVECHGSLQNGADILVNVRNIIERRTAVPPNFTINEYIATGYPVAPPTVTVATPQSGVTLQVADLNTGGSVALTALLQVDAKVLIDIEDTRSGAVVRRAINMSPSVGRVHSTVIQGLPTSVYRARAYSDDNAIRSATTLFVVLADASEPSVKAGV